MVVDLHAHVLPGLDDGPAGIQGSIALARAAVEDGTTTLVATPHIDHGFGVDPRQVPGRVAALRDRLAEADVSLEVCPGGELALGRAGELDDGDLAAVGLGAGGVLLVEAPLAAAALSGTVEEAVGALVARGHRVLLAHPERSPALQRDPAAVERMVAAGVLCQLTAGALVNEFGAPARDFAHRLLRAGLVHVIASDAHRATGRPPRLGGVLRALEADGVLTEEGARWLGELAPAALLGGGSPGPAPQLSGPGARVPGARRRLSCRRA